LKALRTTPSTMAVACAPVGNFIGDRPQPETAAGVSLAGNGPMVDLSITSFGLDGLLMTGAATSAAAGRGPRPACTATRTAADGAAPPVGEPVAVA